MLYDRNRLCVRVEYYDAPSWVGRRRFSVRRHPLNSDLGKKDELEIATTLIVEVEKYSEVWIWIEIEIQIDKEKMT